MQHPVKPDAGSNIEWSLIWPDIDAGSERKKESRQRKKENTLASLVIFPLIDKEISKEHD